MNTIVLPKSNDVDKRDDNSNENTLNDEISLKINHKDIFRTKRSYIPVEMEKRQQLIKAVEEEGLTIKEAAQNLKINYSTAKHIVKVYKRTGEISTLLMSKRLPDRDLSSLEAISYRPIAF